jgi:hypothetical protein
MGDKLSQDNDVTNIYKTQFQKNGTSNKHAEHDFNHTISSFSTRDKRTKVNPKFSDGIASSCPTQKEPLF